MAVTKREDQELSLTSAEGKNREHVVGAARLSYLAEEGK